jgi:hypothetical protein
MQRAQTKPLRCCDLAVKSAVHLLIICMISTAQGAAKVFATWLVVSNAAVQLCPCCHVAVRSCALTALTRESWPLNFRMTPPEATSHRNTCSSKGKKNTGVAGCLVGSLKTIHMHTLLHAHRAVRETFGPVPFHP